MSTIGVSRSTHCCYINHGDIVVGNVPRDASSTTNQEVVQ